MAITRTGNNLVNGNFIPELYSKEAQLALERKLCAAKIINRNYEGQIKNAGDTVYIRQIDNLSMSDYTVNSTISWTDLPDDKISLVVDKAKNLAFKIDDIDAVQSDIKVLQQYGKKGGYAVANDFDQYIFSLHADALTANKLGTTSAPLDCGYGSSEYSPIKILAAANRLLDLQDVDDSSRWFAASPLFIEQLFSESGKAIEANSMGSSDSIARNGFYKNFMGFDVYKTNNLASDGTYYACMFGTPEAISGAQQITKTESVRLQDTWATGMRMLSVYGAKVVRPEALGVAYLKFDFEA